MDLRWNDYVGRDLDGFPVLALLGTRDERAFFLTMRNGEEALLQAARFEPAQLERWTRAIRLSHPNLIQIFAAGELQLADDQPRIVYAVSSVPDDDLSEQLARGAFDRDRAASLVTSIASALDYLHGQGFAHGAVTPANVFLLGDSIRLAADTPVPAPESARREDLRQLGDTVRAAAGDGADDRLQSIIDGTQSDDPDWTPARVLQTLAEPLVPPPPRREPSTPVVLVPPVQQIERPPSAAGRASPGRAWFAIAALAGVVVALAVFVGARGPGDAPPPEPAAIAQPERPSPAAVAQPPRPSPMGTPRAVANTRARAADAGEGWAVIAATYGGHTGAQKRATAIRERWPEFEPVVFPPAGEGRHYYVVLGSGLTKAEAEDLHRRARRAGMPSDTYVTKLRTSEPPAGQ